MHDGVTRWGQHDNSNEAGKLLCTWPPVRPLTIARLIIETSYRQRSSRKLANMLDVNDRTASDIAEALDNGHIVQTIREYVKKEEQQLPWKRRLKNLRLPRVFATSHGYEQLHSAALVPSKGQLSSGRSHRRMAVRAVKLLLEAGAMNDDRAKDASSLRLLLRHRECLVLFKWGLSIWM